MTLNGSQSGLSRRRVRHGAGGLSLVLLAALAAGPARAASLSPTDLPPAQPANVPAAVPVVMPAAVPVTPTAGQPGATVLAAVSEPAASATPPADRWRLDPLNLSGSVRGGFWSSDRTLDDRAGFAPGSVWLKAAPTLGGGWYANAEGWVLREQPLDGDGHAPGNRAVRGELREGFVGWRDDTVQVTLGRRIIAWGRADRINPTDVISSRDYTRLFTDDDDLRRGSVVATAAYSFGDLTATALWLPEFRPDIYPIPQKAGVTVRQGADRFAGDQGAVRLERIGDGFDWSLSYFNGLNRNPGARLTGGAALFSGGSGSVGGAPALGGVAVSAVYNRVQTWGADVATNVGEYGLRGEIAYSQPGRSPVGDLFNPHAFIEAVGGIDRNFGGGWNVNLQYVLNYVVSYVDPTRGANPALTSLATEAALVNNQRLRIQHGPTLRVGYSTLNDTLLLEVSGIAWVTDGSFLVRPRVTYVVSDNVKIVSGADIFSGASDSYMGQLRRNTTFLSEIRYSF